MKILTLTLIVAVCISFSAFAEYAGLDGKWVEIKGPRYWDFLGLAPDKETCDDLSYAFSWEDKHEFNYYLESFDIIRIKNNTSAVLLDVDINGNKAKVTLIEGLYRGHSGWIPIQWLKGNEFRPGLTEKTAG